MAIENMDRETAQRVLATYHAADKTAQKSALTYLSDFDAQSKKLAAKHSRVVNRALASGNVDLLALLCADARNLGIQLFPSE